MSPAPKSKPGFHPRPIKTDPSSSSPLSKTRPLLGARVALYRRKAFTRAGQAILLILLLAGIILMGYCVWQAATWDNFRLNLVPCWTSPLFWAGGVVVGLVILWTFVRFCQARPYLAVYQNGLLLRAGCIKKQCFLWSEIAGIAVNMDQVRFLGLHGRVQYSARIFPAHSRFLKLDERYPNLPEALSRIKASLYTRLQPVLQADLITGQWIGFGPLAIHQTACGICKVNAHQPIHPENLQTTIPWSEMDQVTISAGFLVLKYKEKGKHRRKEFSIAEIPNLELLLQMIQQVN